MYNYKNLLEQKIDTMETVKLQTIIETPENMGIGEALIYATTETLLLLAKQLQNDFSIKQEEKEEKYNKAVDYLITETDSYLNCCKAEEKIPFYQAQVARKKVLELYKIKP